ncbi:coproporphyrinogen III oxidase [Pseudomonas putida]|uniref:coproporphyrinogen III oxidase n=1 Tax=Pseudomonas putida TaxID=303 RepID=UPI0023654B86|nr:coproporphyrinogen III oxidase [Pseudomonas putida]MDD2047677.1 coproporphyrinogen III oxidase [Pseudomonas putida]
MLDVLHFPNEQVVRRDQGMLDPNSYVDVRRFHGGVGSLDVLRALRNSRQQQRPLSLNVQVPARLRTDGQSVETYLQALAREIDLVGCHLGTQQRVEQFHLGGTTPAAEHLQRLMAQLHKRFNFLTHESGDYCVDVDLHHTKWATMGLLRDQGFNHVSIGVPDIGDGSELSVDRYQNPAPINSLIDAARTFDYRSVSVDLGYGHAWQTPQSFALKLATLIELEPDRLQVFDYAQPPLRYAQCAQREASSEQDKAMMRRICFELLLAAGYQHIGLGQFVRPDDDLAIAQERGRLRRNCQGFTRYGYCDHVGFGLGAISQLDALYAQNTEVPGDYLEHLQHGQLATARGWRCADSDQLRQRVMERLACDLQLDIQAIETRYGLNFQQYFPTAWRQLEAMSHTGLVELSEGLISILPAGRLEVDAICQLFEQEVNNPALASRHEWIDHDASL